MFDSFAPLDRWLTDVIGRLKPGERIRMGRRIGQALRRSNAQRIAGNVTPDGEPMEPRKKRSAEQRRADARAGRVRRKGKMFPKVRLARNMRVKPTTEDVALSFQPRVARTAAVHHFGLRDRVARFRGAPETRYPARPLFGFGRGDREELTLIALEQIQQGQ